MRVATILTMFLILADGAWAGSEKVLYSFAGGTDGANPYDAGVLVRDRAGNFYGTTYQGGSCGAGTVFELSSSGKETVLHNFCLGSDGGYPFGGVIVDGSGEVYGTTEGGGPAMNGTVFKLKRGSNGVWTETMLHMFSGTDGKGPFTGLVMDEAGNLYGTASEGGTEVAFGGVVFEIAGSGAYKVLYDFCSLSHCSDGFLPMGGLTLDRQGNLYGTTSEGGAHGQGTVFELSKSGKTWTETVLHHFAGGHSDGAFPLYGSLTLGTRKVGSKRQSVVFGVTTGGGADDQGTAFEMMNSSTGWTFSLLHSFDKRGGGTSPYGTLVNVKGKLFGTAAFGGRSCCGTLFELTQKDKAWIETVLYNFTGGADGGYPLSGVVADFNGSLYGVANIGGTGTYGAVYRVTR
jgi:uncharacterized repeat protein (TIGR03803 family)